MTNEQLAKLKGLKTKISPMVLQALPEVKAFADKMQTPEGRENHNQIPPREMLMARECALKCSVQMVQTWAESVKDKGDPLAYSKTLRMQQNAWFREFLEDITGESQIPF